MNNAVWAFRAETYDDTQAIAHAVSCIFDNSANLAALPKESKILLKPNLLARHEPGAAVTTHPAIVRAVIRELKKRGFTQITLADSPGGPYAQGLMRALYKTSGLAAVCEEEGAELWLETTGGARENPQGVLVHQFNLLTPVLEADFIINLPKIKTHMMTGMSCAVKNLFGCVPGLQKAEFHMRFPKKENFGDMLVDLAQLVAPSLTVVDGVVGMEGDGPAGGKPRAIGVVLGGENLYTIDLAVCGIIGMAPSAVPYLSAAMARGICEAQADAQNHIGEAGLFDAREGYELPGSFKELNFQNNVPKFMRGIVPIVQRASAPRPKINNAKCIGCGNCKDICPASVITIQNGKAAIAPKECIRCFCCHEVCPVKAIDVKRISFFNL